MNRIKQGTERGTDRGTERGTEWGTERGTGRRTDRRLERSRERSVELSGEGRERWGRTQSFFNVHYAPHPIYFHLPLYKNPRLIICCQNFFRYKLLILSS